MVAADETTLSWLAERVPEADPAALGPDPGAPYDRRTSMLFGDAKASLTGLIGEIKNV